MIHLMEMRYTSAPGKKIAQTLVQELQFYWTPVEQHKNVYRARNARKLYQMVAVEATADMADAFTCVVTGKHYTIDTMPNEKAKESYKQGLCARHVQQFPSVFHSIRKVLHS